MTEENNLKGIITPIDLKKGDSIWICFPFQRDENGFIKSGTPYIDKIYRKTNNFPYGKLIYSQEKGRIK